MKDLKLSLIVAAIDRATAPLRRIGEGLEGLKLRTEKLHAAMHKLGLAEFIGGALFTGAVVEAGRAAVEIADKYAEIGESAKNAATSVGLGADAGILEMQRWSRAATQLGVDASALPRAFGMMEQHVSQAITGNKESRNALKQLGITIKEIRAISNDPAAMVSRIMRGFEDIKNATVRTRIGRDFFGRGWLEVAPLLTAPREDIERLFAQIDKSGVLMTQKDAEMAEAYLQSKRNMGWAADGLAKKISFGLMPALTKTFDAVTRWIEGLKPEAIDHFTNAVAELAGELPRLLPRIERAAELAISLANKLLKLSNTAGLVKGVLTTLVVFLALQLVVAFAQTAIAVTSGIVAIGGFVEVVGSLIALSAGVTGFADAMALLDIAIDASPIGVIVLAVTALVATIALVGTAVVQIYKHWSGVGAFFRGVWNAIRVPLVLFAPLTLLAFAAYEIYRHWSPIAGFFAGVFGAIAKFAAWGWGMLVAPAVEGWRNVTGIWAGLASWFKPIWTAVEAGFAGLWKRIVDLTPAWIKSLLKIGAVAAALTVHAVGAEAHNFLNWAPPAPVVINHGPGQQAAGAGSASAPGRPGRAGANAVPAPVVTTAELRHKIDLFLHIDSDGQPVVKGLKSSSPAATLTVDRGRLPG